MAILAFSFRNTIFVAMITMACAIFFIDPIQSFASKPAKELIGVDTIVVDLITGSGLTRQERERLRAPFRSKIDALKSEKLNIQSQKYDELYNNSDKSRIYFFIYTSYNCSEEQDICVFPYYTYAARAGFPSIIPLNCRYGVKFTPKKSDENWPVKLADEFVSMFKACLVDEILR